MNENIMLIPGSRTLLHLLIDPQNIHMDRSRYKNHIVKILRFHSTVTYCLNSTVMLVIS